MNKIIDEKYMKRIVINYMQIARKNDIIGHIVGIAIYTYVM